MEPNPYYSETNKISYNLLTQSVDRLKIFHSYHDSVKVGGDDLLFDYMSIFVWSDFYIYQILIKVLAAHFQITYELCYIKVCWNSNSGVARHPREALYPYGAQTKFRLWLMSEMQKYYDETEHLKNREKLKDVWKTFQRLYRVETSFSPLKNRFGDILYYFFNASLIEWKSQQVVESVTYTIIDFDEKNNLEYWYFAFCGFLNKHKSKMPPEILDIS